MSAKHRGRKPGQSQSARLTAYALGQLGADERAAVETDVASSDSATEYVETTRKLARHISEATHHLDPVSPSPSLRAAVERRLAVLEAESEAAPGAWPLRAFRDSSVARQVLALAACILLAAIPLHWVLIGRQGVEVLGMRKDQSRANLATPEAVAADAAAATAGDANVAGAAAAAMSDVLSGAEPSSANGPTAMDSIEERGTNSEEKGGGGATATAVPGSLANGDSSASPSQPSPRIQPGKGLLPRLPEDGRLAGVRQGEGSERIQPRIDDLHDSKRKSRAKSTSSAKSLARRRPAGGPIFAPVPRKNASSISPAALASIPAERPQIPAKLKPQPAAPEEAQFSENDFRTVVSHPLSVVPPTTETTSFTEVRQWLLAGQLPPPEAVRIEELISYFPSSQPAGEAGKPFSVSAEVGGCPWNNGHRLVRICIKETPGVAGNSLRAIEVEFNPARVDAYRLIGHDRFAADVDPAPDAKQADARRAVHALYELIPAAIPDGNMPVRPRKYQDAKSHLLKASTDSGELLTLRIHSWEPGRPENAGVEHTLKDVEKPFADSSSDFRFAAAVAAFGMVLRDSPFRGTATFDSVEEIATSVIKDNPGDPRSEFLELVRRARQIEASLDTVE